MKTSAAQSSSHNTAHTAITASATLRTTIGNLSPGLNRRCVFVRLHAARRHPVQVSGDAIGFIDATRG